MEFNGIRNYSTHLNDMRKIEHSHEAEMTENQIKEEEKQKKRKQYNAEEDQVPTDEEEEDGTGHLLNLKW